LAYVRFDLAVTFSYTLSNIIIMKKKDIYTLGILIILTIATARFSNNSVSSKYIIFIVLGLSITKFLLVAFNFMELKKANSFWKIVLVSYLVIFSTIIFIVNT